MLGSIIDIVVSQVNELKNQVIHGTAPHYIEFTMIVLICIEELEAFKHKEIEKDEHVFKVNESS